MSRKNLPPVIDALTHEEGMKPCMVATSLAVHTVKMGDGTAFAAVVFNQPGAPCGVINIMDREEIEVMITLLRNGLDDADRINAGKRPIASEGSTGTEQ